MNLHTISTVVEPEHEYPHDDIACTHGQPPEHPGKSPSSDPGVPERPAFEAFEEVPS